MNESCNGLLKQQIIDENGLYKWELKYFQLNILSGILSIFPHDFEEKVLHHEKESDLMICKISLMGSKYAKEWSISTPTIGSFGFDLIWSTGRIWSFLAEEELICKKWVQCLNQAIQINPVHNDDILQQPVSQHHHQRENKIPHHLNQQIVDESSATQIEGISPQKKNQERSPEVQTAQRYHRSHPDIHSESENNHHHEQLSNHYPIVDSSYLSSIPTQSSPSDISPESKTSDQSEKPRYPTNERVNFFEPYNMMSDEQAPPPPPPLPPTLPPPSSQSSLPHPFQFQQSQQIDHERDLFNQLNHVTEKCQHYHHLSEQYRKEADAAKFQMEQIREEWSEKYLLLENKIRLLTEKEIRNSSNHHKDLENTMIRVQSENQMLHEATIISLKEQHRREVKCLQEELSNERNRCGQLILNEKTQRDVLESNEFEIRQQVHDLQIKSDLLEKKLFKQEKLFQFDREKWVRERDDLERGLKEEIERLQEEREEIKLQSQHEIKNKITEISLKYNQIQKEMEKTIRDTIRREVEEEKHHQILLIEKKCHEDIEGIKQEERKKSSFEIQKLKDIFLKREKETTEDLMSLEELHNNHIEQLREEINQYQMQLHQSTHENKQIRAIMTRKEEEHKKEIENLNQKLSDELSHAESLEMTIKQTVVEIQEAKLQETMYRNKLQTMIEENHLQHNEILNLQRQCQIDLAMAESWKIASKESELSLTSYETSLSIANEEIKILENNYKRVEEENRRLKEALYYADTIVYGTSSSSSSSQSHRNLQRGNGNGNGMKKLTNRTTSTTGSLISSNKSNLHENRRCIYSSK